MSDINVRIGGDNSDYKRALESSERMSADFNSRMVQQSVKAGENIGGALEHRLVGSRHIAMAIAAALGINLEEISKKVARLWMGFSEAEEEALKKTVETSEKAAEAQIRSLEKAKVAHEKAIQERLDQETKEQDIVRDAREKGRAIDEANERKHRQAIFDLQQMLDGQHSKYVEENLEQLRLEAKAVQGLTTDEAKRLEVLKLIAKQKIVEEEITSLLALKKRTPEEQARLNVLIQESGVIAGQIKDVGTLRDEIATITPVIEGNIAAWEKFKVAISSTGRGDKQLSDRELERKISNIQSELSASAGRSLGTYQGMAGTGSNDFLTEQQRGAANKAQAELDFRRQVRQTVATQGADAAFRQFDGLNEQRFREINQFTPAIIDLVAEAKKINSQLTRGVPTVLFGADAGA